MKPEMSALLSEVPRAAVDARDAVVRDFEERIPDCLRLAFCVALGVLHNREGSEDVTQEAVLRAFQNVDRL